jgi:hypothetical protein
MNEIDNIHAAAALAAGASIAGGLKMAYGRPRRAQVAQAARQARAQRRLEAAVEARTQAPISRIRPAASVVQHANRTIHSVSPTAGAAKLDVGTLEELLAGLFSLRNDLNELAEELAEMRDHAA